MSFYRNAKMTAKAREAIETYASHYRIAVEDVRHDRAAIKGIYGELEELGYAWIATKQAWAYTQRPQEKNTLAFSVSADSGDFEDVRTLIEQGLKAWGYQIISFATISSMFDGAEIRTAIVEVKI